MTAIVSKMVTLCLYRLDCHKHGRGNEGRRNIHFRQGIAIVTNSAACIQLYNMLQRWTFGGPV
jgi:hypothetical protein